MMTMEKHNPSATQRTKRPREDSVDSEDGVANIDDVPEVVEMISNEEFMGFSTSVEETAETVGDGLPPWADGTGWKSNSPPLVALHNEILRFCDLITLSQEEKTARELAVTDVTKVLKSIWPDCTVKLFGSELTGLCLPSSDLDIACLNVPMQKVRGVSPLRKFADEVFWPQLFDVCAFLILVIATPNCLFFSSETRVWCLSLKLWSLQKCLS